MFDALIYSVKLLQVNSQLWHHFTTLSESPLKMTKSVFCFILKTCFVFKIFKFLWWSFRSYRKRSDKEANVNFENYDVTYWETNNYNKHTAQYLKKWRQRGNKIWLVNRISHETYFPFKNHTQKAQGAYLCINSPKSFYFSSVKQFDFIVCSSLGLPKCINTK